MCPKTTTQTVMLDNVEGSMTFTTASPDPLNLLHVRKVEIFTYKENEVPVVFLPVLVFSEKMPDELRAKFPLKDVWLSREI